MERHLIAYLDTQVVIWLAQAKIKHAGKEARRLLERSELLISPIVSVELQILHEIGRIKPTAGDVWRKVAQEMGAHICKLPITTVCDVAANEKWTRDPFDRIIVAQAKANSFAYLISADQNIAKHYPRTVW